VQKALASLPWAKNVQVDFGRKKATFSAEPAQFDATEIVKVLKDQGFEGKIVP